MTVFFNVQQAFRSRRHLTRRFKTIHGPHGKRRGSNSEMDSIRNSLDSKYPSGFTDLTVRRRNQDGSEN